VLDLSWVHRELAPYYSHTGRPSIDPVLMIRMLIVGYVFAIRSERRICAEVQVNLAYRWFCKLGIEDPLPSERQAGDPPRVGKEGVRRPWARHTRAASTTRSLPHAYTACAASAASRLPLLPRPAARATGSLTPGLVPDVHVLLPAQALPVPIALGLDASDARRSIATSAGAKTRKESSSLSSNVLFQVMANATSAAATIKTAIVAMSTVMQVASFATRDSRWALRAPCRAGRVGIAGRKSTGMEFSSRRKCAGKARENSVSCARTPGTAMPGAFTARPPRR
jgi:hypothetical protein